MSQSQEAADKILRDLLAQELEHHPLGQEVLELARRHKVDIHDIGALAQVIAQAGDTNQATDPRAILLLSLFLEKMITHTEELNRDQLKRRQQDDKSEKNSISGTTS